MKGQKASKARKSPSEDTAEMIKEVISRIKQIDYWSKENTDCHPATEGTAQIARPKRSAHTVSVKNKYYERTANHVRTQLFSHHGKKESNKLSLQGFHNALIKINNTIRLDVARHNPALPSMVAKWCKEYPQYSAIIKPLVSDHSRYVKKVKTEVYDKLTKLNKVDADMLAETIDHAAKDSGLEHPIIKYLALTSVESARRKKEINERLRARKANKTSYSLGFITRIMNECLNSSEFNELALGVALATGRRSIEVIHQGEFKALPKNKILFSGQAKKGRGVNTKPYKVPTLVEPELIASAVDKLRSTARYQDVLDAIAGKREEDHNGIINKVCARMLNYTAKRILDPKTKVDKSEVKFKDTRVIAIQTAILKIMPSKEYSKQDINVFVENYCGHDGFAEFANYQHIAIEDAPESEKEATKTKEVPAENADIGALESADSAINDLGKKTLYKLHERVKELARRTGEELNQSFIYKGRKINGQLEKAGGSLDLIKTYLAIPAVAKAIKAYNVGK